ncbi:hypothetical protein OPIT5_04145 [Opitutaceae bacterium TAV5]|nr:hypothetical protein OPIT5_04145 [Opitutaceae bacterium TAV5]
MKTKTSRIQSRILLALVSVAALAASSIVAQTTETRYSLDTAKLVGTSGANTYVFYTGAIGGASLAKSGDNLAFTLNVNNPGTYNYGLMAAHFDAVSLKQIGASITLDYAITVSSNSSTHFLFREDQNTPFRVGLFDSSASTHITGNNQYMTWSGFQNYTGYSATYAGRAEKTTYNPLKIRPANTDSNLFGGMTNIGSNYSTGRLGTSAGVTDFTGIFKLERISDTEIRITSKVNNDTEVSTIVSSSLIENFDTFGIAGFAGSDDSVLTFTKLNVIAVIPAAVPEPGTWALFGGTLVLLATFALRRARRR